MTVAFNISISQDADNPPLNDSVQTIELIFNEKLDPKTIADSVKLYRIDGEGSLVEEPINIKIDPTDAKIIDINNKEITGFTQGEEYQVVVSRDLKSKSGSTLASEFVGYFATNYKLTFSGNTDLNNTRTEIHVISDIHLGVDDSFSQIVAHKQSLVDYLNQIRTSPNVKELVIAGDLLDDWIVPMNYTYPDSQSTFFDQVAINNSTVVEAINSIIREGFVKVTYIPGDHDLLATEEDMERIFPGINQVRDNMQGLGTYITGSSSEILIEHSHRYDFFSAPDPLSNQDITENGTSILPPAYFYDRIGTSSIVEGFPSSNNTFSELPDNKDDASQYDYFLYSQVWKNLLSAVPVKENYADSIIKTSIDGYTQTYAINDVLPHINEDGSLEVNLYKDIVNTWDDRQTTNEVKVKIPVSDAITKSLESDFIDQQAQTQIFNTDQTKRIVVFGHTHVAKIIPMTNTENQKTIYANSGTWVDQFPKNPTMTFVVITPQKEDSAIETVNLYRYSKDKSILQWDEGQAITLP